MEIEVEEGILMATETDDFMTEDEEAMPQDEELMTQEGEDLLATETDDTAGSAPASGGRRTRNILAIAIILIVTVAGVVVGVLLGGKDNDGSSSSFNKSIEDPNDTTDAPVNAPTTIPTQATVTVDPEAATPPPDGIDPTPEFEYYLAVGPLSVEVPIYSPDSVAVFETEEEAKDAFSNAGLFLINNVILRILGQDGFQNVALGQGQGARQVDDSVGEVNIPVSMPGAPEDALGGGGSGAESDSANAGDAAGSATDDLGNANGYETNNQEDKVDQGDFSKSDGTFIYTAFGDQLVIMRSEKVEDTAAADPEEAQLVLRLQMPEIEWPPVEKESPCYGGGPVIFDPIDAEPVVGDFEFVQNRTDNIFAMPQEPVAQQYDADSDTGNGGGFAAESPIGDADIMPQCNYRSPKPYIQSLLISEGRLGVVVSGYGARFRAELNEPTVISDFLGTHVRLYDTSALNTTDELKLLGVQDVHGYFKEGFMIDGVAHIVTMTSLNTWDFVIYQSQRSHPDFDNLDTDQYVERVTSSAGSIAERFSVRLNQELLLSTSVFPKIATLSLAIEGVSDEPGLENVIFGDGYLNSMVQISSFNTQEASVKEGTAALEEPELQLTQTVKFLPTYWAHVYSAADKLVVAGQGSRWDPRLREAEETTHLFTFSLNGNVTEPEASGTVPGSLLNEYSIDYVDGYLRVATTIRNRWLAAAVFMRRPTDGGNATEPSMVGRPNANSTRAEAGIANETGMVDRPGVNSTPPVSTMVGGNTGSVGGPGQRALQVIDAPLPDEEFMPVAECSSLSDACMDNNTVALCNEWKSNTGCKSELFYTTESCNFFCMNDLEDSQCPLPDGCMTVPNFINCLSLEKQGCENLNFVDLDGNTTCPIPRVQCGQNFGGEQPISKCPVTSQDPACVDEERLKECLEVERECWNLNVTDGCPFDFTCLDDGTGGNKTICPEIDDVCFIEERQQECMAIERECEKFEVKDGCPIEFFCLEEQPVGNKTNCPAVNPQCFDKALQRICIAMERECSNFQITDGCPVELSCLDDDDDDGQRQPPASRTVNQLFVLNANATHSARLEIVGNVTLGEKNEGTLRKFHMCCTLLDPQPKLTWPCHFQFLHPLGCLITLRIL
jgi:hypothetical protein